MFREAPTLFARSAAKTSSWLHRQRGAWQVLILVLGAKQKKQFLARPSSRSAVGTPQGPASSPSTYPRLADRHTEVFELTHTVQFVSRCTIRHRCRQADPNQPYCKLPPIFTLRGRPTEIRQSNSRILTNKTTATAARCARCSRPETQADCASASMVPI